MIRIHEVRLVGVDGQQIGVVATIDAKRMAQGKGLDLVEVAPMARPPVCRIMDYGKYRFELAKKDKGLKSKQHIVKIKELKYHPRTGQHDYEYRLRQALGSRWGTKSRLLLCFVGVKWPTWIMDAAFSTGW